MDKKEQFALEESYLLAEKIMKERATSFYQAFQHLPRERFRGVTALYAFCRYADDIVDYKTDDKLAFAQLQKLELSLQQLYEAELRVETDTFSSEAQPWWLAFVDTIERFKLPIDSFLLQIAGQRSDIAFQDVQTIEDFIEYCRLVAGSVGTMLLPLLAADKEVINDPSFIKACENLGVAMQITNILRDIGEDLRTRNRVYIPQQLLTEYQISRSSLEELVFTDKEQQLADIIPAGFINLWEHLSALADAYYQHYEPWICAFHPLCQFPLVAAALSYQAIADAVREESYNCFTKRCYTSAKTRDLLINKAQIQLQKKGCIA